MGISPGAPTVFMAPRLVGAYGGQMPNGFLAQAWLTGSPCPPSAPLYDLGAATSCLGPDAHREGKGCPRRGGWSSRVQTHILMPTRLSEHPESTLGAHQTLLRSPSCPILASPHVLISHCLQSGDDGTYFTRRL